MPDYNVKFLIDNNDLQIIRASGQRLTLAKPLDAASPNVIWLSIDPFASTDVEWTEEYGIYASTTQVSQGARISKLSESAFPAQDGAYYSFTSAAVFNGPFTGNGVGRGSYGAQNDMPSSSYPVLTFGLTQTALVNQQPAERKPLSATPVLATQFANMTPFTIVYAWLQAQFASETIITQITGKTTKIRLGGGVNEMTLKYDPGLGVFVPVTSSGKLNAKSELVELRLPAVF